MAKEIADLNKEAKHRGVEVDLSHQSDEIVNYFSVHGTVPNSVVAAKSHLCEDMHQHLITMSQNIKSEVIVPLDFSSFKGHDGLATVTGNIQKPFAIQFGSEID